MPMSEESVFDEVEEQSAGIAGAPAELQAGEPLAGETPASWQTLVETAEVQARADDPIVQLVQEYKEAIKARDEAEDKYLRAAAEFANARRRADVRADNQVRAAKELILSDFLPVIDDLDRAVLAVPADEQTYPWLEGFALIQRKLAGVLERQGVTLIEAEGQPFDPALHQAVMMEETDGAPPGTVVQELQKGYLLDGRVLRPAMVKVAQ